jgi:hypothetical protein
VDQPLQIVPYFPPTVSGVGDYAHLLGAKLLKDHGLESSYLVTDPFWPKTGQSPYANASRLPTRSATGLAAWLVRHPSRTVLLHFVGYGYQKRGCPLWLLNGLRRWRKGSVDNRLIVMFHELAAFGPPWRSSFWCAPLQRFIVRRLALLAHASWTNARKAARRLEKWLSLPEGVMASLPVFSTVGEPRSDLRKPLSARRAQLLIFGGSRFIDRAIANWREELDAVCHRLGLERIVAIGAKGREPWTGTMPFLQTGVLPSEQVCSLLLESRFAYLDYFKGYLGKSTIFAAYCAHGVVPLFPTPNGQVEGVCQQVHYVTMDDVLTRPKTLSRLESIAENASGWYMNHNLTATASFAAEILGR